MLITALVVVVILCAGMAGAWAWALRTGSSGLIDGTWSLVVGVACLVAALGPPLDFGLWPRRALVAVMALAWSLRLGGYIFRRTHGAADDPRYAQLKREWGTDAPRQLFLFLQAQAVAGATLAGAVFLAARAARPELGLQDLVGAVVFLAGWWGEALADKQMGAFRADPKNKGGVCDTGLWAFSRHPNYFCEWLCWLGVALIAVDPSFAHPWSWLAILAPAQMYYLLVHVSGVPPLEAHMERTRPAAFGVYKARVSMFWPLPPRRA